MDPSYTRLMKAVLVEESPRGLLDRVIDRISLEMVRMARRRAFAFGAGALVSLVFVVAIGTYLSDALFHSGFYAYATLALSGDAAVYANIRELTFALLESMPVVGIALLLAALAAVIYTSAGTLLNARRSRALTS